MPVLLRRWCAGRAWALSALVAVHGLSDYGLLTSSEMADNTAVMAASTGLPLIADAHTGYGNELNVTRTAHDFKRARAAAIYIQDQVALKRCGHLDGKEVAAADEFVGKIAPRSPRGATRIVIVARTDS